MYLDIDITKEKVQSQVSRHKGCYLTLKIQ